MKIKEGFILRPVGEEYMAVAIGAAGKEFNGLIRVNASGGYLWKELQEGITEDALVAKMLERYDDLDEETARKDLREFVDSIRIAIE